MLRYSTDLKVNNVDLAPYLTDVQFEYEKVWGKDTGRNTLTGKFTGTLLGIFPKITCTFRKLTQDEIKTLVQILDTATQTVKYYDPYLKTIKTITTYSGNYSLRQNCLFSEVAKAGQPFDISFIATTGR